MKQKTIMLNLSRGEIDKLKALNGRVIGFLEEGQALTLDMLSDLEAELSRVVEGTPELKDLLKKIENSGDYYLLRWEHPDTEILNLPWSMAKDPVSGRRLADIGQLYLSRSVPGYFESDENKQKFFGGAGGDFLKKPPARRRQKKIINAGPPLKVLVMISSPEDSEWEKVLSYEEEELGILYAFHPLLQTGLVEIDFTEDGSLQALTAKLKKNKYHVLHFSGHGVFKDDTGFLQLEDPLTLKTEIVKAADFAEALNCNPDYRVPLVVLSSCQTAKGSTERTASAADNISDTGPILENLQEKAESFHMNNTEKGLRGVTNQLLKKGVRAVVSMSLSVSDFYAAQFSARFYRAIAERENIFSAFNEAVKHIKDKEQEDLIEANISPAVPLQWLIPNLYLGGEVEHLVDWDQAEEKLDLSSHRPIAMGERIVLEHDKNYLFIGRRKDKAAILKPFFDKTPILLKGQGGVGKTALAEHLAQRLAAKKSRTVPFVFNEQTKALDEILDRLEKFLLLQGNMEALKKAREFDKGIEKFFSLVFSIAESHEPVFIFDNLETFQVRPGQDFAPQYGFLMEVIAYLVSTARFYLILTCRYPLKDMGEMRIFDLNQVSLNDFWKKCNYLDMKQIGEHLREEAKRKKEQGDLAAPAVEFIDVVKLLHRTFGGNYRALEFFDRLLVKNPDKIAASLASLEKFQESFAQETALVKAEMGRNLLFSQLMALLEVEQREVLVVLANFRTAVLALALRLQKLEWHEGGELVSLLKVLHDLTLVEISFDPELENFYYYVTPIVKDLLKDYKKKAASFSYQQAGGYHYYMFQNMGQSLNELEEAFYFYYLSFAYEVLQPGELKDEDINAINEKFFGGLRGAIFQKSPPHRRRQEDADSAEKIKKRIGEIGDILSNFYHEYSMFHTAFYYAERTYHLLGGETPFVILNRLGVILKLYGKYDEALLFYEKSLAGYGEIGDKSGEIATLHNIAQIALKKEDTSEYLEYETEAYQIALAIGDAMGLYYVGRDLGQVLCLMGQKEEGLMMLQRSYEIGLQAGFPGVDEIAVLLKEFGDS